jgi:hypothetical protein
MVNANKSCPAREVWTKVPEARYNLRAVSGSDPAPQDAPRDDSTRGRLKVFLTLFRLKYYETRDKAGGRKQNRNVQPVSRSRSAMNSTHKAMTVSVRSQPVFRAAISPRTNFRLRRMSASTDTGQSVSSWAHPSKPMSARASITALKSIVPSPR